MSDLMVRRKGAQKGDRLFGFECIRTEWWGGAYGTNYHSWRWACLTCSTKLYGNTEERRFKEKLYLHMARGHAPCEYCGQQLFRRQDGTPRQHNVRHCPAKSDGHKIEREFVKNMTVREYV